MHPKEHYNGFQKKKKKRCHCEGRSRSYEPQGRNWECRHYPVCRTFPPLIACLGRHLSGHYSIAKASNTTTWVLYVCLTIKNVPQLVYQTTLSHSQVILYNFFGESADARLWQHLVNADGSLEDPKHVPLIYEVSYKVIPWDLEE